MFAFIVHTETLVKYRAIVDLNRGNSLIKVMMIPSRSSAADLNTVLKVPNFGLLSFLSLKLEC